MLSQYNEENFAILQQTAQARLRPDNISGWFLVTFIYSTIMLITAAFAVMTTPLFDTNWFLVPFFAAISWLVHLVLMLVFISERVAYKLQRLQAVALCFIAGKLSIEGYMIYFLICADQDADLYMYVVGLVLLAGGFLLMIVSTIRAFRAVRRGDLREDGNGLFQYTSRWLLSVVTAVIALIFISNYVVRFLPVEVTNASFGAYFGLFLFAGIQYLMAMATSEFFLLTYCKFRYHSFIVEPPIRNRKQKR
ncbi:hypothetical protein FZW96_08030 [Bacillus sp. BGMRC 2118]|nr:hypothetical protein FZW96_08030 [Bacillus sp. BGMRC 2118]